MNTMALVLASFLALAQDSESDRLRKEAEKLKADQAVLLKQLEVCMAQIQELNDKADKARLDAERAAKAIQTTAPAPKKEQASADLATRQQGLVRMARLLEEAFQAFLRKKFDRCSEVCDEILRIDPQYSVARELKEDARKVTEKPEYHAVLAAKVEEWKKSTNSVQGLVPWPQTVRIRGAVPDAAGASGLAAASQPASAQEHVRLAELSFRAGDFEKALSECGKALQIDPTHPSALALQAEFRELAKVAPPGSGGMVFHSTGLMGKVSAVASEIGLVVLTVGRNDGVQEGDEFRISRSGLSVAKVRVDRVERAWSSGKVTQKNEQPRVSDHAVRVPVRIVPPVAMPLPAPAPLSRTSADEVQSLRNELDEVRNQVRQLSDRLVPAWQGPGVSVDRISEELRVHLGIGRGLLVRRVREGSTAEKAGLKAHDVVPDLLEAQLIDLLESGTSVPVVRQGQRIELPGAKGK